LQSGVPHHAEAQWLGVTSVHSSERMLTGSLVVALRALCDRHPKLRIIINFHDAEMPVHLRRPAKGSETDDRIQTTHMPTALLLWRRILTPHHLAVRNAKVLWLFDKETIVHPSVLPLGQLVEMLLATGAMLIQPARSPVASARHPHLANDPFLCMAKGFTSLAISRQSSHRRHGPSSISTSSRWCPSH